MCCLNTFILDQSKRTEKNACLQNYIFPRFASFNKIRPKPSSQNFNTQIQKLFITFCQNPYTVNPSHLLHTAESFLRS